MIAKVELVNSVKQITNLTRCLKMTSIDEIYPLGFVYVQYPQKKAPSTLFPTLSWQEIYYSGAFFRASGTGAAPFIISSGTLSPQPQGTSTTDLSITKNGSVYGNSQTVANSLVTVGHGHSPVRLGSGSEAGSYTSHYAFFGSPSYFSQNDTGYTSSSSDPNDPQYMWHGHSYTFTPSVGNDLSFSFSSTDTETRPVNYTIKLWKRV